MLPAYFLTWHTYGTWLHGDGRGSVDAMHNRVGMPLALPDAGRVGRMAALMAHPAVELTLQARGIVEDVIVRHCDVRRWMLHAKHVGINHVHVVVSCPGGVPPDRAMEQFKAWGTRLLREGGILMPEQPAWVEHGSTRWIRTPESLAKAIDYVKNRQ